MEIEEDNKKNGVYAWEASGERSWRNLEEDKDGNLVTDNFKALETNAFKNTADDETLSSKILRKGIIRYVVIVIDLSKKMDEVSIFRPNCLGATLENLNIFISEFFERNPLSFLGIVTSKDGKAQVLTPLSSSKKSHLESLKKFKTSIDFSLQNSLEVCLKMLNFIPKYFSREIFFLQASLSTCDPHDIFETIEKLKKENILVSFISLSAEMYICKKTSEITNGSYFVAKSKDHFKELVLNQVNAPLIYQNESQNEEINCSFMPMGFPETQNDFFINCPRCYASLGKSELPIECIECNLNLIQSSQLSKSHHHLFPVPKFRKEEDIDENLFCQGCGEYIEGDVLKCPRCSSKFCSDCDRVIHDSIQNCPGC